MRTIPELFAATVERSETKPWLLFEESSFTYGLAHERIASMASALHDLGVVRGTPVLASTRNSPDYLFSWLALMWLGAICLPVNPESSSAELVAFAAQLEPRLIVTDLELRERIERGVAGRKPAPKIVLVDVLGQGDPAEAPEVAAHSDDLAVLIPTSGTTGRSKLVMQTHRAYVLAGEGFPFWLGLEEHDRLMTSLPLFHINAPAYSVLGSIAAGASLVLLPRFSGSRFLDQARRYGATEFNAIGAMVEILMRQPQRHDDAENPLRLCYTGPSPARERQLEIERRFGFEMVCGYALSETPYGLIWRKGTRPYGTLGSPRQHPSMGEINRARVVVDGRPARPGETGELELSNPAVMVGYYGMPEETRRVLRDGWLLTGDLVRVNDDGTFTFIGRKKDVIRRRGENLSPVEVERVLETHPAVAEAAVVGVPSELSEEDIKAFVVASGGIPLDITDLRGHVAARLAPFKVPRYFEIVRELPHTPTGRIAKHELPRERTAAEVDLEARVRATTGEGG
jgi:crotonobetaine/carnitine-CoA ligase